MDATSLALQLTASVLTIATMWLYGNKDRSAPLMGLLSEIVWIALVIFGGLWGLLPLCVITTAMQFRNLIKWNQ